MLQHVDKAAGVLVGSALKVALVKSGRLLCKAMNFIS